MPRGRLVWRTFAKGASSRLMTMKALSPRPKAIWFEPLSQKSTTGLAPATRRNATMLAMDRARCSHTHSPGIADAGTAAQRGTKAAYTGDVLPAASDGGPESRPACVERSKAKLDITEGSP